MLSDACRIWVSETARDVDRLWPGNGSSMAMRELPELGWEPGESTGIGISRLPNSREGIMT